MSPSPELLLIFYLHTLFTSSFLLIRMASMYLRSVRGNIILTEYGCLLTFNFLAGLLLVDESREGFMRLSKKMKHNVAYLAVKKPGVGFDLIGTTFVVFEKMGDDGVVYLVTCRHVIQDSLNTGEKIYLRVNKMHSSGVDHVELHNEWKFHPDDDGKDPTNPHNEEMVDLAVLEVFPVYLPEPVIVGTIDIASLVGLERYHPDLLEGDEVVGIGLFKTHPGHERNLPVARFGSVSLVTDEKLPGVEEWLGLSDYYLTELKIYPGMSGAPVYTIGIKDGEKIYVLLGVACGYYDEREEKMEPFNHYGISLVVPVQKLIEILFGEELVKEREEYKIKIQKEKRSLPASAKETEDDFTREDSGNALQRAFNPGEEETSDEVK